MSPQADDPKPVGTETPLLRRPLKSYPKQLWASISHNLQWKILALFLAICLWVGLILQDPTLTRERVFTSVPLSVTGSDTLRRNGLIVIQGLEEENAVVRLKVDVPQQLYYNVSYSNYNPRLDLTKITEAGEQTLKVTTTSSSTYGNVTDVSPDEINLVVDDYITNYRIPVQVETIGEYPEGFYGTTPALDVSTVTVSGPESVVSQIARIVLDYNLAALSAHAGYVQTALPLRYVDANNNELDATLLEPTSSGVLLRSIVVMQSLYPTKALSLNQTALTTGSPKSGYEVKSITAFPSVIIAAGDETTLSTLDTLFLEEAVDVSGREDTFTAEIEVTQPDNVVYMNTKSVTLIIEIGPVPATKSYDDITLSVADVPEGMTAASETASVSVSITGPELSMETIRSYSLTAFVSAQGLTAGTYDLPIQLSIDHEDADQFTYTIAPQSVSVTITEQ